jgi:ParB family chromosome partitioning protein|tara:strand:- start:6314 stop:7222 length:909 start_codon:yes stop_codon:yes gene_type:complete
MTEKRKLGRGLEALLSSGSSETMASLLGKPRDTTSTELTASAQKDSELKHVPIELIQRGKYQPRTDMHEEALEELANSIKKQGIMQPIVIRPISADKYEIIAGERRWRACQIAGLDTIPALIKPVGDEAAIAMSLIENIQRENLNPIEEAVALKRLQDEFELTQQEVADAVGRSRAAVTNLIRLIGLSVDVRKMLEHGDLEMGHARALLSLDDACQSEAARSVVGRGLNVRQTEALVRRMMAGPQDKNNPTIIDPDIKSLEENLAGKLGAKVLIQHTAKGKGKLILKYNSLDELDGILSHIN